MPATKKRQIRKKSKASDATSLGFSRKTLEIMEHVRRAKYAPSVQQSLIPNGNSYALPESLVLNTSGV